MGEGRKAGTEGTEERTKGGGLGRQAGRRGSGIVPLSPHPRMALRTGCAPWTLLLLEAVMVASAAAAGEGGGTTSTAPFLALTVKMATMEQTVEVFEPARSLPSRSEATAIQPVVGIGQRVKMRTNKKKDLGMLGYVLGLVMVVIIITIGVGITVGYVYKWGRDLKAEHEQKVYEREMQRITLPLSAFTNQACELMDENTIVVHTNQTPVEDSHEGAAPLMDQVGTPGAGRTELRRSGWTPRGGFGR